jgi:bilin biosynthesis protein
MDKTSHSIIQSVNSALSLSSEEVDALLYKVENDLEHKTFDYSDEQLIQQMIECMGDSRGLTRLGFAESLGIVGKPAVPFLLEALANHANVVVKRASAKTLTLIADPNSIPVLLNSFLHDEDQVVRNSCIGALAQIGEVVVPSLFEILADSNSDETIKGHAAWALAFIGIKAKAQLYAAFDSASISADLRSAIVGAILKIVEEEPEEKAFNLLMNSLQDSAVNVRSEAAAALGNLAYKPAIPLLIELLDNQEPESRKSAALALMKIKEGFTIDALQIAFNKELDPTVKQVIQLAINQIKQQIEQQQENDDW